MNPQSNNAARNSIIRMIAYKVQGRTRLSEDDCIEYAQIETARIPTEEIDIDSLVQTIIADYG